MKKLPVLAAATSIALLSSSTPQANHITPRVLNLSGLSLTEIPKIVFHLPRLQELDLSSNLLTSLPPEVALLSDSLFKLDLAGNALKSLPTEISTLKNLVELDLEDTGLIGSASITSLGGLSKIEVLSLKGNTLDALPESVGTLVHLRTLDLSGNTTLTDLPLSMRMLVRLEEVNLDNTSMTSPPPALAHMTSLRSIYLRGVAMTPEQKAVFDRTLPGVTIVY